MTIHTGDLRLTPPVRGRVDESDGVKRTGIAWCWGGSNKEGAAISFSVAPGATCPLKGAVVWMYPTWTGSSVAMRIPSDGRSPLDTPSQGTIEEDVAASVASCFEGSVELGTRGTSLAKLSLSIDELTALQGEGPSSAVTWEGVEKTLRTKYQDLNLRTCVPWVNSPPEQVQFWARFFSQAKAKGGESFSAVIVTDLRPESTLGNARDIQRHDIFLPTQSVSQLYLSEDLTSVIRAGVRRQARVGALVFRGDRMGGGEPIRPFRITPLQTQVWEVQVPQTDPKKPRWVGVMERGAPCSKELWEAALESIGGQVVGTSQTSGMSPWVVTEFVSVQDPTDLSAAVNEARIDWQLMTKEELYRDQDTYVLVYKNPPDLRTLRQRLKWKWFLPLHKSSIRFSSPLSLGDLVREFGRLDPMRNITHLHYKGEVHDLGAGDTQVTLQGFPEYMTLESIESLVQKMLGQKGWGVEVGFIGTEWAAVAHVEEDLLESLLRSKIYVGDRDHRIKAIKGRSQLVKVARLVPKRNDLENLLRKAAYSAQAKLFEPPEGSREVLVVSEAEVEEEEIEEDVGDQVDPQVNEALVSGTGTGAASAAVGLMGGAEDLTGGRDQPDQPKGKGASRGKTDGGNGDGGIEEGHGTGRTRAHGTRLRRSSLHRERKDTPHGSRSRSPRISSAGTSEAEESSYEDDQVEGTPDLSNVQ